jgi:hypothetical protein
MKAYICFVFFVVAMCNTNGVAAKNMNLARANLKGLNFLKLKESMKNLKFRGVCRGGYCGNSCFNKVPIHGEPLYQKEGTSSKGYINTDALSVSGGKTYYRYDCSDKKFAGTKLCTDIISSMEANEKYCGTCTWPGATKSNPRWVDEMEGGLVSDAHKNGGKVRLGVYCEPIRGEANCANIKKQIEKIKKRFKKAKKNKNQEAINKFKKILAPWKGKLSTCRKHTLAHKFTVEVDEGSRRRRLLGRGGDGDCRL